MRKVFFPILSRAQWGRCKSILHAIDKHPDLELDLYIGGSAFLPKFGVKDAILKEGFNISGEIVSVIEGDKHENMATTVGLMTIQLVQLINCSKPDIIICHADRYEQLAVATAASYLGIPLAHLQGGEVSGNIDDKVRNAITMLADIHFPATNIAMWRLKDYGIPIDKIFNVGCPSIDVLKEIEFKEYDGEEYLMVVMHPVTDDNHNFRKISEIVHAVYMLDIKTIWIHSNIDPQHTQVNEHVKGMIAAHDLKNIHFVDSLSPEEFYRLMKNASCLIGNTSSGLREGNYLETPYVCLGDRQKNREHGENVRFLSEYDALKIMETVQWMKGRKFPYDGRFGNGNSGEKLAKILAKITLKGVKY